MKEIERLKTDIRLLINKVAFLEGVLCAQYPCIWKKIKQHEKDHKRQTEGI